MPKHRERKGNEIIRVVLSPGKIISFNTRKSMTKRVHLEYSGPKGDRWKATERGDDWKKFRNFLKTEGIVNRDKRFFRISNQEKIFHPEMEDLMKKFNKKMKEQRRKTKYFLRASVTPSEKIVDLKGKSAEDVFTVDYRLTDKGSWKFSRRGLDQSKFYRFLNSKGVWVSRRLGDRATEINFYRLADNKEIPMDEFRALVKEFNKLMEEEMK